jgi:hypothetical protein
MGQYDPITNTIVMPADQAVQTGRQKEMDRVWGMTGISHRDPPQGSYNPIRHAHNPDKELA